MRRFTGIVILALLVPVFASAQSADLQATIRAALAGDPRTNAMSPEDLDALAAQLAAGARERGMTPHDITWAPIETQSGTQTGAQPACSVFPQYFCAISEAFGFMGGDPTIAIWLGAIALMFLFLAGEMRYLHKKHQREAAARAATASFSGSNLTP